MPVTFPEPSNDPDVHTTSPVIPTVLPVASAVAVSALPVKLPVTLPSKYVLFNSANFVDESLASIVYVPAFCAANSMIPSSVPSVTSPALPVILE